MALRQTQINLMHYTPQQRCNPVLLGAAFFYALAVKLRLWAYRQNLLPIIRLTVPVISIGNLTTGGTGKTPVVISLARFLEQQGLRVAVLSRGYGANVRKRFQLADAPIYGDEAYLIQKQLGLGQVFVGKDRAYTGKKAIETFQPDIILMDDGFQHLRLHRDLNILLVDGEKGFGNGHLFPAGPLREPLHEISRAHWILQTKQPTAPVLSQLHDLLQTYSPQTATPIMPCPFEASTLFNPDTGQTEPLTSMAQHNLILLSAIAQPEDFERMVREHISGKIRQHFIFQDHHPLGLQDITEVQQTLAQNPDVYLITTEKDWVKLADTLARTFHSRVRILTIQPVIDWVPLLDSFLKPLMPDAR